MIEGFALHNLFFGGASLCFGHTKTTCSTVLTVVAEDYPAGLHQNQIK